jgi:two-component system, NarL family, sensor histidine kinase UhpB
MKRPIKPLSILLVEDNPGDQILFKKFLERSQVSVAEIRCAERLSEVEKILTDHAVDLAFLDLTLPDSTGTESFVALNQLLPHTPIIVLSGLSDVDAATETIALGAQDYLMKGEFEERLLMKTIQYSIERKKIQFKLEESNERYEIVNKATRDIIWDWNLNTREIYVSDKLKEIFGYESRDVNVEWFIERLHPEEKEKVITHLKHAIVNGLPNWEVEFRLHAANGEYRFAYAKGYILFNSDRYAIRMIGSITDITEKRKLENELVAQKLNHQKLITEHTIQAQEKEREELGKELHDNINQVLATVKMFLDMARKQKNMQIDLVNRSHENVSYAIEEIRKLSKSLVAPSLGDLGLKDALEDLAEEINFTQGFQIELTYENKTGRRLDPGIELMLYRITQEQLNNISKYAKSTKTKITVIINGETLCLTIIDNGVGFDPEKKAKGIGLKNIGNRVEFYNGRMEIISAPGEGCRMEIEIPLGSQQPVD